jgi:peptidyl-Asp metalloendopeptidase
MDTIHALRDTYHADLVSLLVAYPGSGTCGLGWHMTTLSASFESLGFNVVNYACAAAPQNSFAHELGHNMGLAHDRLNATNSVFPYAYGYAVPGQFRTIMAYNCSPSCPRVRHFGNPNITYNGIATGTAVDAPNPAYEALALDNTAATVAAFRQNLGANQLYLPYVGR